MRKYDMVFIEFWNTVLNWLTEPMPVTGMTGVDILMRILCALLAGLVIGLEREVSRHPAGLRTNMLVSLGACIVMITAESICNRYNGIANPDPARLGAQVISGVGFLGAGTIIHKGVTVQGLTTAASLWTVACLGLAAGDGDYFVVIVCAVLISLILSLVDRVANAVFRKKDMLVDLNFHTTQLATAMNYLNELAEKRGFYLRNVRFLEENNGVQVEVRVKFKGTQAQKHLSATMAALFDEASIKKLTFMEVKDS